MKKLFIMLVSLGLILPSLPLNSSSQAYAEAPESNKEINFQKLTLNQAIQLAKKEHKLIFINTYAVWCQPCKMMHQQTYHEGAVADYFNKHFINLDVDVEKDNEGRAIAQRYGVKAHPCLLFVNEKGQLVKTILGFYRGSQLLAQVQKIK